MSKKFSSLKQKVGKIVITGALVCSTAMTVNAASNEAVTTANLNMRTGASTSNKVVRVIPKGAKVKVIQENGKWYKVEYKGQQGFSFKKFLKVEKEKPANKPANNVVTMKVKVDATGLNVREGIGTKYKIKGNLKDGTLVKVVQTYKGGWCKIEFNGGTGFVNGKFLTKNVTGANTTQPTKPAQPTKPVQQDQPSGDDEK